MFHDADLPELTKQIAHEQFRRELAEVIDLVDIDDDTNTSPSNPPKDTQ